jgi:hypothetical protein
MNNNSRTDVNGAGEGPLSSLPFQTLQTAAGLLPIPAPAVSHNNGAPPTYTGGNAAPQAARPTSHAGKARAGGRKLCEAPGCNTTANYGFQGQSKCCACLVFSIFLAVLHFSASSNDLLQQLWQQLLHGHIMVCSGTHPLTENTHALAALLSHQVQGTAASTGQKGKACSSFVSRQRCLDHHACDLAKTDRILVFF